MRIDGRAEALPVAAFSEGPGGVRVADDELAGVVRIAEHHMASIRRWGPIDPTDAWFSEFGAGSEFSEFGAGSDLHVPFALFALGVIDVITSANTLEDIRAVDIAAPDAAVMTQLTTLALDKTLADHPLSELGVR